MATVAYVIRSDYDPADRERLERETGQHNDEDDPWQTESSSFAKRRLPPPPSFVPATTQYDDWEGLKNSCSSPVSSRTSTQTSESSEIAKWYRSLPRTDAPPIHNACQAPPSRPASVPVPKDPPPSLNEFYRPPKRESINKNNWFISRALRSVPPLTAPSSPGPSLPSSSLADILVRDPPPLPSEERFRPPVWLHIGPGNRGFSMLQRSGWNEGEGLGAHIPRLSDTPNKTLTVEKQKDDGGDGDGDDGDPSLRRLSREGKQSGLAAPRRQGEEEEEEEEVIDLTGSDSEPVDVELEMTPEIAPSRGSGLVQPDSLVSPSNLQVSLLTPLPTVLKADRLGIGLKAKTEGPYGRAKKRVTHNAAALAAHMKASEEIRREKAKVGRGSRGFAKLHKREEEKRKVMLAYLNG